MTYEDENIDKSHDTSHILPPLSFNIPKAATQVLIGDSNLRKVDRKRLDPDGKTFVRSIGGLTILKATGMLHHTESREDITNVCVHVGTNDIDQGKSQNEIIKDTRLLISELKKTFPSANIGLTGMLPQKGIPSKRILELNQRLENLIKDENLVFLWDKQDFFGKDSFPTHLFEKDKYHMNERGVGVLLRRIKKIITTSEQSDTQRNKIDKAKNTLSLPKK